MTQAMRSTCGWHCTLVSVALASAICGFYTGLYAGSIDSEGRQVRLDVGFFSSPKEAVLQEDTAQARLSKKQNELGSPENSAAQRNKTGEVRTEEMPHVEECGLCFLCHKEKQPLSENLNMTVNGTEIMRRMQKPSKWRMKPEDEAFFKAGLMDDRSHKPNCTECYGCDHNLRASSESTLTMLEKSYPMESGASSVWVLTAEELGVDEPKSEIVKRGFAPCQEHSMETIRNTAAVQKIVEDCGFEDIVPNSWIAPVNGVIEGVGYHINWDGMWFDLAKGVSVELFLRKNPAAVGIELLRKANSTQVTNIALFDLLTSQCDRHSQNIFIDGSGQLTLIDNDNCLSSKKYKCGVDSMLLPTTEEYAIHQVGYGYVLKHTTKPRKQPALQTMLDYRCHAPGGKIGKKYPPRLKRCMENISSMTLEEITTTYGLQDFEQAEALQSRSKAMLERGFEWALEFSPPYKPSTRAFQWYKPCCDFNIHGECADEAWHTDARLPPF
ncbi:hypothetical protein BSKO_07465 [Bryopsis sp. KO-2023]|nr:hypothetical protein BSKO_07465 [Bryopsis sp. KO-2023]